MPKFLTVPPTGCNLKGNMAMACTSDKARSHRLAAQAA